MVETLAGLFELLKAERDNAVKAGRTANRLTETLDATLGALEALKQDLPPRMFTPEPMEETTTPTNRPKRRMSAAARAKIAAAQRARWAKARKAA